MDPEVSGVVSVDPVVPGVAVVPVVSEVVSIDAESEGVPAVLEAEVEGL